MIGALVTIAVAVALVAVFLATPAYLRRHPDKRGSGSPGAGLLGATFDNVFHPSAVAGREQLDEQQRLVVPAPSPDDDKGVSGGTSGGTSGATTRGRIRIDL